MSDQTTRKTRSRVTPGTRVHREWMRGNVLHLTRTHMALLNGLLDLPKSVALSRLEWFHAAVPHMWRHRGVSWYWVMIGSQHTLPTTLYTARRFGNQWIYALSERGHAVLAGEVPVHVITRGRYAPVTPHGAWR